MTAEEARAYLADTAPEERLGVLEVQARQVLAGLAHAALVECEYCRRPGKAGETCAGCGAPVRAATRSSARIGPPVIVRE